MAYRVNAQFSDGSTNHAHADVVDAPLPRPGDTIAIARDGRSVSMRVVATWTPSLKFRADGLVVVEAREILKSTQDRTKANETSAPRVQVPD